MATSSVGSVVQSKACAGLHALQLAHNSQVGGMMVVAHPFVRVVVGLAFCRISSVPDFELSSRVQSRSAVNLCVFVGTPCRTGTETIKLERQRPPKFEFVVCWIVGHSTIQVFPVCSTNLPWR